jgi:hypothetical protein
LSKPSELEHSALESKYEALALENARLAHENMMMQNARLTQENMLLRLQTQGLGEPVVAEGHWWPRPQMNAWAVPPYLGYPPVSEPPGNFGIPTTEDLLFQKHSRGICASVGSKTAVKTLDIEQSHQLLAKIPSQLYTTVMMRNLPNNMTREALIDIIDAEGFRDCYDFFYLPLDFKNMVGLGYSFVNLLDPETARRFHAHFSGFSEWGPSVSSEKVCEVSWSNALQGRDAHIERYRNSPVMHESMLDEAKPMLFENGKRLTFPEPTKRIRVPKKRPTQP